MRLLIVSDSPALRSGLGRVVRELARRFVDDGDEVAVAGWFHTVAPAMDEDLPYGIIPCGKRETETVDLAIDHVEPDVVLAIGDPEDFQALAQRRVQRGGFLLVGYFNIESEPIPPHLEITLDGFDALRTSSMYGARVVGRREVEAAQYGVDTSVFAPKTPPDTVFGRDMAKTFVVMVNAQNTQRKNIATGIQGFAQFSRKKDNVLLYLNTQLLSNPGEIQGPNLHEVIAETGIGPLVCATRDPGPLSQVSDGAINDMYAMATVLLAPSWAEGFNLPVLEAMATRTVPVATKGFSHLELLDRGRGIFIPPATVVRGYHGHDLFMVSPEGVRVALSTAYQQWLSGTLGPVMDIGLEYAQGHSWDATYADIAETVHGAKPSGRVATGQPIDGALRARARRMWPLGEGLGILKMGTLGDMLQLTAVVEAARRKYDRPVTIFTNTPWGETIFGGLDQVTHVRVPAIAQDVALRALADQFEIFLDVRYVSRAYGEPETDYFRQHAWFYERWAESSNRIATLGEHTTQVMLRSLGLDGPITPVYPAREPVDPFRGRWLAVCAGVGHPLKAWDAWDLLAAELGAQGWDLVQIGGKDDPFIQGTFDCRGFSLPLTAGILEQVHALITTEGAMHHLAAAVGCKAYVILGPTPAVSFVYPGQVPITVDDRCSPCFWSAPMWPRAQCALGEKSCIRFPDVAQVLMEVAR
jgi:glycosyltransferase involved in cell wall biosynthesis